jgi:hypothetical protein
MEIKATTGIAKFTKTIEQDTGNRERLAFVPENAEPGSGRLVPEELTGFAPMDPLMKQVMQARLDHGTTAAVPLVRGPNVLYTKDEVSGAGSAAPARSTNIPADVASLLAEGAKVSAAKAEFTGAQQAIAAGDYTKAYGYLESLMRKQGEEVLSDGQVKATETARDQLEFLSSMQKAGVKPDYPPTEGQLIEYFKTLKDKPEAARQAFHDYAFQFHVHPGVLGRNADVVYSKDNNEFGTHVPDSWPEVANRPSGDKSRHIGKQMNDCEGYAFMADKLFVAAGFRVAHHIVAIAGPNHEGHSMVAFGHPKEKGFTVTSNHYVVHKRTEKEAAVEGFKAARTANTGEQHYYIGKTMTESQIQASVKDHEL